MNEQHGNRIATTILNRLSELGYEVRESGSYAKLEAEAQALRDQVKALQSDANSYQAGYDEGRRMGTKHRQSEVEQLTREVEALRASVVVVPERRVLPNYSDYPLLYCEITGFNDCLDELARLNGKVVSEGLLRDLLKSAQKLSDRASNFMVSGVEFIEIGDNNSAVMELEVTLEALRAVLDDGKEVLDANPADA